MRYLFSIFLSLMCSIIYAQDINLETIATGFTSPTNIINAGDDRLFVVEQAGVIKIINANGTVNTEPFLDINSIVINGGGERGLLGLAFHPDYEMNGYFYLNYINNQGNTNISRFTRSDTDGNLADETSELILLTYEQPFSNHNGGDMIFGADGYLYISSGDGGDGGDPGDRAQSLNTLLGKILRIDVDTINGDTKYGIPPDNPFVGSSSAMQEIWAYGLRNPWKFSFDRTTNELWIADVGQSVVEEINLVSANSPGLNYGWRCYEGNLPFNQTGNCPPESSITFPIASYTHSNNGLYKCSITGGYRYRGTSFPNLVGLYFFADYCSNEIGTLTPSGDSWTMAFSSPFEGNGWSAFGEDVNGEIYIAGNDSGIVYKIVDTSLSIENNTISEFLLFPNPANDHITITSNSIINIESVAIYDVQGKLISSNSNFDPQSNIVSIKSLTSGLYFVDIRTKDGRTIVKKFIKD